MFVLRYRKQYERHLVNKKLPWVSTRRCSCINSPQLRRFVLWRLENENQQQRTRVGARLEMRGGKEGKDVWMQNHGKDAKGSYNYFIVKSEHQSGLTSNKGKNHATHAVSRDKYGFTRRYRQFGKEHLIAQEQSPAKSDKQNCCAPTTFRGTKGAYWSYGAGKPRHTGQHCAQYCMPTDFFSGVSTTRTLFWSSHFTTWARNL